MYFCFFRAWFPILLSTINSHIMYPYFVAVASFTEIKTGYRGFEMKQNPVFRMLVLYIENYSQAYMSDNFQMEMAFHEILLSK